MEASLIKRLDALATIFRGKGYTVGLKMIASSETLILVINLKPGDMEGLRNSSPIRYIEGG